MSQNLQKRAVQNSGGTKTKGVRLQPLVPPKIDGILDVIDKATNSAKEAIKNIQKSKFADKQRKRGICVCGCETCNIGPFKMPGGQMSNTKWT